MSGHSKRKARDEADRRAMEPVLRHYAASGQAATALGEAARYGHTDLMREFFQAGVGVNARDGGGCTPLMLAASGGNAEAIRLLIQAGADVNARDDRNGRTPLTWLVAAKHPVRAYLEAARLLLDAGADPNCRANDGTTALDWAKDGRPKQLVELLRQAGAQPGRPGRIQADVNLDDFRMVIRRKGSGYVAATGFGEVELPAPDRLRQAAVDWLLGAVHPPAEEAASLLARCELSYRAAGGKDVTEPIIEVEIAAPKQAHKTLRDEMSPLTQSILEALMEVCPDLGSHRLVRKA
jgi:Ankyrin repeats (3 copies)